MGYRFNPPPGWPPMPAGWVPPPGWQADPSWPPPPDGWEFWVSDDPDEPTTAAGPAAAKGGGDGGGGDHPAEGRGRRESGSRAQTIAVIVAVIGMLGSTLSVLIGDYLEDRSRQQEDRRLAYIALKNSADDFEEEAAKEVSTTLRPAIESIQRESRLLASQSAQRDSTPEDFSAQQDLSSQLDQAAQELESVFGTLTEKYRDLQRKLDEVRLLGSGATVEAAWGTSEAARLLFSYLVGLNDRFVQVNAKIRGAIEKNDLKRSDLALPQDLAELAKPDTWNKLQPRIDLCRQVQEYFSVAEDEINPGKSSKQEGCQ
jgi:hypothetical protein